VKREFSPSTTKKKVAFSVQFVQKGQKYQEKEAKNIAQNERIPPET
jgi:hypothetical protein